MTRYLRERTLFGPLIDEPPTDGLRTIVVIPAKDEEYLIESLNALYHCDAPKCPVEVIVVVNTSERDAGEVHENNARLGEDAIAWAATHSSPALHFHILLQLRLPKKHAGVGLARKIGMDEACRRLAPRGVIACFDADSLCDRNYLTEIEKLFDREADCQAVSIYFEHPTEGERFPPAIYDAIIGYELHLRYFVQAQRWAGFPFATQTIGSSMAVRCQAYQDQNGMNKRQAGEDFYFLHKFTPLGHVHELNTTRVIPSPRPSHRVPFGTGKAVEKILESNRPQRTYAPQSFEDLRSLFSQTEALYHQRPHQLPESITSFLATLPFAERLAEIRANVTSLEGFQSRFYRYFNAFLIMKYVHHARDHFYPDTEISKAAGWLLGKEGTTRELLSQMRELDRNR